ncbi:folylpolyglutamate synthase/dihydrofolate synthase family protein [Pseudohongiella nitratireducens]|uniref:bifunctional folylpolyglutamate synthase/dihydrofolate synthase n=1 Tax=Pseudohongiella nitratireducens TaxID=1768907 RepID=UPI0030EBF973|tara:strand:- start:2179 stop:3639 length:1461 start_codon:yes stop_codon:yes gene_type:complete
MAQPANLAQWLDYIQQLHPREIDMGLDRLRQVADRLSLDRPAPIVITVSGTNGKGSHVAILDKLFRELGYRCASYTSPHLLQFNERISLDGQPASDEAICEALSVVEAARQGTSLSFFEFTTLAAFWLMARQPLDVAVLEVGLGGRLDAVNLIDADVAVISSIGLDHQEWLGDTRDAVAREKAGIFRAGKPAVCADRDPPVALIVTADELSVPLYRIGQDFHCQAHPGAPGQNRLWQGRAIARQVVAAGQDNNSSQGQAVPGTLSPQALESWQVEVPPCSLHPDNVASAIQAACLSGLVPSQATLAEALLRCLPAITLPGRLQKAVASKSDMNIAVLLDVSHNPHAAAVLADEIRTWRERGRRERLSHPGSQHTGQPFTGQVRVVLAMMADKDHLGYVSCLENQVDFWYIGDLEMQRCMKASELSDKLKSRLENIVPAVPSDRPDTGCDVSDRFGQALSDAGAEDLIVVCGSFFTVARILPEACLH